MHAPRDVVYSFSVTKVSSHAAGRNTFRMTSEIEENFFRRRVRSSVTGRLIAVV